MKFDSQGESISRVFADGVSENCNVTFDVGHDGINPNLFDDGIFVSSNYVQNTSGGYYHYPLNLKTNTTYTFSCGVNNVYSNNVEMYVLISDDITYTGSTLTSGCYSKWIAHKSTSNNNKTKFTFTTLNNPSYLMINGNRNLLSDKTLFDELKIEEGNQATAFSPYAKKVANGSAYGDLPVPQRAGYAFDGWRGKNLFDKTKYDELSEYPYSAPSYYLYNIIQLEPNTTYKISVVRYNNFDGKVGVLLFSPRYTINYWWSAISHRTAPNVSATNYVYTTASDGVLYIGTVSTNATELAQIWANTDVMIEVGDVATEFEPFISSQNITEQTLVTSGQNHTLVAKWAQIPEVGVFVDVVMPTIFTIVAGLISAFYVKFGKKRKIGVIK